MSRPGRHRHLDGSGLRPPRRRGEAAARPAMPAGTGGPRLRAPPGGAAPRSPQTGRPPPAAPAPHGRPEVRRPRRGAYTAPRALPSLSAMAGRGERGCCGRRGGEGWAGLGWARLAGGSSAPCSDPSGRGSIVSCPRRLPLRRRAPLRAPTPANRRPPPGSGSQSVRGEGRGHGAGERARRSRGQEEGAAEAPLGAAIFRRGRGGRCAPLARS